MRGVWSRAANGGAESPDTCVRQKHDPFFLLRAKYIYMYILWLCVWVYIYIIVPCVWKGARQGDDVRAINVRNGRVKNIVVRRIRPRRRFCETRKFTRDFLIPL